MRFNTHSEFKPDDHAFLSPSKYHWINDSEEKLEERFYKWKAAQKGTELHDFARRCIELGQKLPKSRKSLNAFVNDAIGYRMSPEVLLVFSPNCFGTADAISFDKNILRIHDYKSGVTPCKMTQLELYAALFCLEYNINPETIDIELRIYQNDEIVVHYPDNIFPLMGRIVEADKQIASLRIA